MIINATESLLLSSLIKYTYITHFVKIPSNGPFSLMKSPHCFPKIHLEHSITQSCRKSLTLNSLPNDIFLRWSKLKAFADDTINVTQIHVLKFVLGRVENSGKRRKCWLPAFSLFPAMFSKGFFLRSLKVGIVW